MTTQADDGDGDGRQVAEGNSPQLFPRTFPRGQPPPLFARVKRRTGEHEFCLSVARFDGRGAGSAHPPPLAEELAYARLQARALLALQRFVNRDKGSKATAAKGAARRVAIQKFALSVGWPARHSTKKTIAHFAPLGDGAPKSLRCSERVVKAALGHLRREPK